ncbi:putative glucan endo-1,3-beta-glucosidase [Lachnellula hyalina]|uniref:Probable glucan endo-1,3-beta-glucosidase eglC n=1 Tax=Lachnellula hyalina TaxID=1316788 RepID=A0A8H8U1V8_9HELO|nr:putative glucan endo-1,3-beta-glucosidase [Lachnellula hyalina]TVY28705.1 putative glucan endo-1,3-beta-glucosidase [Lachnellula hyalina]
MKAGAYALALAATLTGANAYWKGFNVQATLADGTCKSQADWENDFNKLQSLPGGFSSLRVYAASDCNTLANAVPAAVATGGQILVGVWTEDSDHFNAEKQALLSAVQQYGFGWVVAVSVGSEDLYRGDTTASTLASQIYDVRGMLSTVSGYTTDVQVGHVDTWTAWVDSANTAVIEAADFIGTDAYPYFQNTQANSIDAAYDLFWDAIQDVKDVVNSAHPGAWVWVTESGWPTSGSTENQAVPSVDNAQQYWKTVACSAFNSGHTFWYTLEDFSASPSFGVLDSNGNALYDLSC